MHARGGTKYLQNARPEQIGHCVAVGCPGTLQVTRDGGGTTISCTMCPASWPPKQWIELRERMEAQADAHPGVG